MSTVNEGNMTLDSRSRPERYPGRYAIEAPDRVAVIHGSTGWTQTYRELDAQANRLSTALAERGLAPGDHVVVLMENHQRFVEAIWGAHYAGLVYTTCSTRLTADEVAYIAADSGARAMICSAAFAAVGAAVGHDLPDGSVLLAVGGEIDGFESYESVVDARAADPLPPPRVAGSDMLYSSGTTGRQKAIVLPTKQAPLETAAVGTSYAAKKFFGFDESTVYLSPAPLYHGAGIRFVMATTALGGTAVIMDKFDAAAYLELVERHHVTHTQVVPTMMLRMMRLADQVRLGHDVSSLRYFIHSAAPCPRDLKEQVIDWLGPVVYEYYAGTESNGLVLCDSTEWLAHPGTVGRPIGCEVYICDDDGDLVATGETGTVYFGKGPEFEYRGDAAKTAGSRHPKGWSTLGDVGHVDEEGFLYLTDRKAFMIISGGVNIYPQEAENALSTHPAVLDVAVFGVPHPDFGEQVKAVVRPVEMPLTDAAAEALAGELMAFCRTRLADVKCPRTVDFREELPRDLSGKMLKQQLRQEYLTIAEAGVR
ncbi:AMP-binding protein [Nocardioides sp. CPCC 206347]|uniref:AMP-binding protein n=1 Tax=unclassified Nocardioides TaxID=2615069 RepID=UPI003605AEDD